jgi:hypothetical protein
VKSLRHPGQAPAARFRGTGAEAVMKKEKPAMKAGFFS